MLSDIFRPRWREQTKKRITHSCIANGEEKEILASDTMKDKGQRRTFLSIYLETFLFVVKS